MSDIQTLRTERDEVAKALATHVKLARDSAEAYKEAGGETKYKELHATFTDVNGRIKVVQDHADMIGEKAEQAAVKGLSVDEATHDENQAKRDFIAYVKYGPTPRGAAQMSKAGRKHYIEGGGDASSQIDGAQALGGLDSEADVVAGDGAVSVPTEVSSDITFRMKSYSAFRQLGTVRPSMTGRPRLEPIIDDVGTKGAIAVPGVTTPDITKQESARAINFIVLTSGALGIQLPWLNDTATDDVIDMLEDQLAQHIARYEGELMTTKVGASPNNGLIDDIPVGFTAAAGSVQVSSIKKGSLDSLIGSVDAAYRKGPVMGMHSDPTSQTGTMKGKGVAEPGFMCHDTMYRIIANLVDGDGRPLLMPSFNMGSEIRYQGHPFYINQFMAEPAANAKSLVFGQLKNMKIYDVGVPIVNRYTDSVWARKQEVGLECFTRVGWRFVDGGDSVKTFVNAAT